MDSNYWSRQGRIPVCARHSFRATSPTEREIPERDRLAGGAVWIQTCGSAILVILRKTGLCETDQCTTEQGLGRILSSRPPVDSNSVTSGPAEVDPVLRAPLPQSRRLGFVREIVPPFEGVPPHQQLLISAVSTSSAEDVANFVVVVGQELTSEIKARDLPRSSSLLSGIEMYFSSSISLGNSSSLSPNSECQKILPDCRSR